MKKTLLRIALAAGLVGAVNWAMNGQTEVNATEKLSKKTTLIQKSGPDDDYLFAAGHPLAGQTRTGQQIADQNLCPEVGITCAVNVNNSNDIIEWDGGTSKF